MTRSITIDPVLNGFICRVGCQTVVFTDKQSMISQLSEYYDKPCEVEKRFIERAVNKVPEPLMPPPAATCDRVPFPEKRPASFLEQTATATECNQRPF